MAIDAADAAGLPCFCRRIDKNKNGFATETKLKKLIYPLCYIFRWLQQIIR